MKTIKSLTEAEIAELPILPDEWKWVKIGEHSFVTKLAGFEYTKYVKYQEIGDIPVIRAQNISKEGFVPRNFVYVDKETMEKLPRSRVHGGEILMVFVGAGLGNVGIVPYNKEYFLGPNVAKIDLEESLNNKYVLFFLSSLLGFGNISGMSKATAQGSISMSNIREVAIPFVALEEQRAIVSKIEQLFSELDNGIANLKLAQEQLKVYRQAVLKKAFEGEFTKKLRLSLSLSNIEKLTLEQITLPKDGLRRGPFGSAIKKSFFVSKGYKVYEQGNAINNDPYKGHYFISEEKYLELINFEVLPGDLLVSCSGVTLGRVVEVPEDAEKGIINQALLRIRLRRDLIESKYFIHMFRSAEFQKMIFAKSQGSAMPNLVGIKEFKLISLNVPSLLEQNAIVQEIETRLSVCDKIEQDIETNLEKAEALRQSILKKAFEGKLLNEKELEEVRKAEDWEPVEVLLERIKVEKARNDKK